jgi:hypothetical protein
MSKSEGLALGRITQPFSQLHNRAGLCAMGLSSDEVDDQLERARGLHVTVT